VYVIVYSPLETGLWAWTRFYSRFLTQVTLCLVQKEKLSMQHPIVPECKEFMEALWVKEGTTQFRTANYCNNFAWLHLLTVLFSVANFVSWGFCWSSVQVKIMFHRSRPCVLRVFMHHVMCVYEWRSSVVVQVSMCLLMWRSNRMVQQKAYTNIGAFLLHAIRLPPFKLSGELHWWDFKTLIYLLNKYHYQSCWLVGFVRC
jgi:hypothetical protein